MPSTGPRTPEGKKAASRNAITHGLLSDAPVIEGIEDPEAWERHRQGVLDSLKPEGYLETHLAERVASLLWRLGRIVRYETEMISLNIDYHPEQESLEIVKGKEKPGEIIARMSGRDRMHLAARLIPGSLTGPPAQRYESHLHRQWLQTAHELEAMQARRRGDITPLARLDITGAPAVS